MTTAALDLPVVLPRGAECGECVREFGDGLRHLRGVREVTPDVPRGLLHVSFDNDLLTYDDLSRTARRIGAAAHCAAHCPRNAHGECGCELVLDPAGADRYEQRLAHVTGLDCADCALKLEGALRHTGGVVSANTNFGAATLKVVFDPQEIAFDDVLDRVRRLGYDTLEGRAARAAQRDGAAAAASGARPAGAGRAPLADARALLTAVSGAAVAGGFAAEAAAPALAPFLFAAAMVAGGCLTARAAWYSLRARSVDMNVLMTIAAIGAAAIGQWSEAGLVVFLFALGNLLQAFSMERTRRAVRGLAELTPPEARIVDGDHSHTVPADAVRPGDLVRVLPGERLPVDGIVTDGQAGVDQSPVTGESMPLGKAPGDEVFAGSIVQGGALTVQATTGASDNTIAKIIHLVEEAQAQRAPLQTTIDRFAARYTPVVVAAAAAVAVLPPLLAGQAFSTWFYRGLALLIISCPCALVISTPVSFLAALGAATRRGVLVKGGVFLERAGSLRAIAFDKTGTLTTGVPRVTDVVSLNGDGGALVLARAAAVERWSEHPLAQAIVAEAERLEAEAGGHEDHDHATADCCGAERGAEHENGGHGDGDACACGHCGPADDPAVTRFRAIAGRGVRGDIDGETVLVGKPELFDGQGRAETAFDGLFAAELSRLELEGKTVVVVGTPERVDGLIAVADGLRPFAREALAALRRGGVRHIALLTGDNQATAATIGRDAGIDEVRAGLLPEEKVAAVRQLAERYGGVAMVGDGVNDAPALAAATVGVAMGAAGSDAALETADIALMTDDLAALAATVRLSRRTTRVIRENIVLAIAVKAVFLALAPLGLVTLWMAVFADMGTSLAVIGNGLRLRLAADTRSSATPPRGSIDRVREGTVGIDRLG